MNTCVNSGFRSKKKVFKAEKTIRELTRKEEIIHSISHGAAAIASVVGLILLIIKASNLGALTVAGAVVFGVSLIVLYSASCLYHASCIRFTLADNSPVRAFFQKCDHSMIFLLIAGTYVPACWTSLNGWIGWTVFGVVGSCCLLGMILNWISVKKFEKVTLALNLITGWTIVIAGIPFFNVIGPVGFNYLVAGGLFYTIGVVFYKLQNIPYMHVVWHAFVIAGSLMHYIMVYSFIY